MRTSVAMLITIFLTSPYVLIERADAQQLITTCGESAGKAFYLEPKNGWVDDGISGGTMTFFRYPNGDYDLFYKDVTGSRSAREDGAIVTKIHGDDKLLTIAAVHRLQVTEIFQLTLDERGRGTLIWSNLKNKATPGGIIRGMLLVSKCSR